MDPRERYDDPEEMLRVAMDGQQTHIWTALPGIVRSFDPDKMTCVVQPAIQGRVAVVASDRVNTIPKMVDLPLLVDCPVVFASAGGVMLTLPIKQDDECLVVFSSRCLDAWWQNGGV